MFDKQALQALGIDNVGYISTSQIVFGEELRRICENNVCHRYGASWTCPPAVGTIEECKRKCLSYDSAMVFSTVYQLEDSFDVEGMDAGRAAFGESCRRLYDQAKARCPGVLMLSGAHCPQCRECTYPHAPCKFPEQMIPSISGYCIYVNKLAAAAGLKYNNGSNTVTYFGILLYNQSDTAQA